MSFSLKIPKARLSPFPDQLNFKANWFVMVLERTRLTVSCRCVPPIIESVATCKNIKVINSSFSMIEEKVTLDWQHQRGVKESPLNKTEWIMLSGHPSSSVCYPLRNDTVGGINILHYYTLALYLLYWMVTK